MATGMALVVHGIVVRSDSGTPQNEPTHKTAFKGMRPGGKFLDQNVQLGVLVLAYVCPQSKWTTCGRVEVA